MVGAWILSRLIQNHYFIDGNKRVGYGTTVLFFELNGYSGKTHFKNVLYNLTLKIAKNELVNLEEIANELSKTYE